MKIIHQKIPVTITRIGNEITFDLDEINMVVVKEEILPDNQSNDILGISKRIGDDNEVMQRVAKGSLLSKETSRQTFIIRKILA